MREEKLRAKKAIILSLASTELSKNLIKAEHR